MGAGGAHHRLLSSTTPTNASSFLPSYPVFLPSLLPTSLSSSLPLFISSCLPTLLLPSSSLFNYTYKRLHLPAFLPCLPAFTPAYLPLFLSSSLPLFLSSSLHLFLPSYLPTTFLLPFHLPNQRFHLDQPVTHVPNKL